MLDRIIKISSLSSAVFIFCGVLKLIVYYNYFHIDIIDFLTLSEIVTSFLDDINILVLITLILLVQTLFILHYFSIKTRLNYEDIFEKMLEACYPHRFKFTAFFFCILAIVVIYNLFSSNISVLSIYLGCFSFIQLVTFLSLAKDSGGHAQVSEALVIMSLFFALILSTVTLSIRDVKRSNHFGTKAIITMKDTAIECVPESGLIYLGKTDNFLFIYSKKESKSVALPTTEVKNYTFY